MDPPVPNLRPDPAALLNVTSHTRPNQRRGRKRTYPKSGRPRPEPTPSPPPEVHVLDPGFPWRLGYAPPIEHFSFVLSAFALLVQQFTLGAYQQPSEHAIHSCVLPLVSSTLPAIPVEPSSCSSGVHRVWHKHAYTNRVLLGACRAITVPRPTFGRTQSWYGLSMIGIGGELDGRRSAGGAKRFNQPTLNLESDRAMCDLV